MWGSLQFQWQGKESLGLSVPALLQKECTYIQLLLKGSFVKALVSADCSGQFLQLKKEKTLAIFTINAVVCGNTPIKILYDLRILTYIKEKASLI